MLVEFPEQTRSGPSCGGAGAISPGTPRTSDRGLIVAVIAAHDEHDCIGQAIRSLDEQSSRPDLTIVCAYDCSRPYCPRGSGRGRRRSRGPPARARKSGGSERCPRPPPTPLRDDDAVLIMDAESFPGPEFVAEARRRLTDGVGGVGAYRARGRRPRRAVQGAPTRPATPPPDRTREEERFLSGPRRCFPSSPSGTSSWPGSPACCRRAD